MILHSTRDVKVYILGLSAGFGAAAFRIRADRDKPFLTLYSPRMANDLPAGGRRLLQSADGCDFTLVTLVKGEITRENGVDTGARPGRLIRGAR